MGVTIKYLLIILLLVGCNFPLEDEGTLKRKTASVTISYNGIKKFQDMDLKYGRALRSEISYQEELFPVYHFIAVEPDVEILWLDNDMVAEVFVPLNTPLWVEYINLSLIHI